MASRKVFRTAAAAAVLFQTLGVSLPAKGESHAAPNDLDRLTQIMSGQAGNNPLEAAKPHVTILETPPHDQDDKTYQFLATEEFLKAAAKSNVRTIGNEMGNDFNRPIFDLQVAVNRHNPDAIKSTRGVLFADLESIEKQALPSEAESVAREAPFLVNYIQNAAQNRIEVAAADVGPSDPQEQDLLAKRTADQAALDKTSDPAEQARIQADAAKLADQILERRASDDVNRPIVVALAGEQNSNKGNLVVAYAPDHCDAMDRLFRQAGYAVTRVALHASADTIKADENFAAQYHLAYRGIPFVMDTMRFVRDIKARPAAPGPAHP
jgi:hypothetical protein